MSGRKPWWVLLVAGLVVWMRFYWTVKPINNSNTPPLHRTLQQEDPAEEGEKDEQVESKATDFAILLLLGMEVVAFLFAYVLKKVHVSISLIK